MSASLSPAARAVIDGDLELAWRMLSAQAYRDTNNFWLKQYARHVSAALAEIDRLNAALAAAKEEPP